MLADIVAAINVAAHPQYVCDLAPDSTVALVPSQAPSAEPPPSSTLRRLSTAR